jgi:hypothetical protein
VGGNRRRAAHLPRNKRWRFEPDAMAKFKDEEGFLARHLVDTQYLSRLAREYLGSLYPDRGEDSGHVWVSPGRLTEMVRRKLGLNDLLPDHNFGGGADQPRTGSIIATTRSTPSWSRSSIGRCSSKSSAPPARRGRRPRAHPNTRAVGKFPRRPAYRGQRDHRQPPRRSRHRRQGRAAQGQGRDRRTAAQRYRLWPDR